MKKIFLFNLICTILVSCEKYVTEISDVTLSGLYVVDEIDVIGNNGTTNISYHSGDIFDNQIFPQPFNHIKTNDFNINFENDGFVGDFQMVWTNKNSPFITPQWLYDSRHHANVYDGFSIYGNNSYSLGTLILNYTTNDRISHVMSFKIEKDGFESLQLLSTSSYPYGQYGTSSRFRIYLTRIHP